MNIQEIYDALVAAQEKLEEHEVEDDAQIDLEILVLQLKKQMLIAAFDPLKELESVTVADVTKLPDLIDKVDRDIANEKKRTALIKKITAVAKMGLRAAGLPIPV